MPGSCLKIALIQEAKVMLEPLLGYSASLVFALALLFAGISSSVTAGMSGGTIFAGIWGEPYDIRDNHTKIGVGIVYFFALMIIFLITDPFQGLIISQMFLSIQLPITVFLQIYLTSSSKVMGKYANSGLDSILLWTIAIILTVLNIMLLISYLN